MEHIKADIPPEMNKIADDLGMELEKKLKLERNSMYGYFLRIPRTDAIVLRNNRNYIELATQKSGVFFTTETLKTINESYEEVNEAYEKHQSTLVNDVIDVVKTYTPVMEFLNERLAELDVFARFVLKRITDFLCS